MPDDINQRYLALMYKIIDNNGVECHDFPEIFYPEGPEHVRKYDERTAKSICNACPVRELCLDYALVAREEYGIWGGLTPSERRLLRRK
jgi:WhiB family redox-sensing transcriptional regulator